MFVVFDIPKMPMLFMLLIVSTLYYLQRWYLWYITTPLKHAKNYNCVQKNVYTLINLCKLQIKYSFKIHDVGILLHFCDGRGLSRIFCFRWCLIRKKNSSYVWFSSGSMNLWQLIEFEEVSHLLTKHFSISEGWPRKQNGRRRNRRSNSKGKGEK